MLYNVETDLNLLDIPKPLIYKIIEKELTKSKDSKDNKEESKPNASLIKTTENKAKAASGAKEILNSALKGATVELKEKEANETSETTNHETSKDISKDSQVTVSTSDATSEQPTTEQQQQSDEIEPKDMEIDEESILEENSSNLIETNVPLDDLNHAFKSKLISKVVQSKVEPDQIKQISAVESKSHKYNVKVLLISLPTLTEINEKLFGSDFDNTTSSTSR